MLTPRELAALTLVTQELSNPDSRPETWTASAATSAMVGDKARNPVVAGGSGAVPVVGGQADSAEPAER